MLELGPGADILRLIGATYWLLALGALAWVLWKAKGRKHKVIGALVVVFIFAWFPGKSAWDRYQKQAAYVAKRDKAMAHFEMRCKSAGEKIFRTVDDVEGVFLLKQRPLNGAYDQNAIDPYGDEGGSFAVDAPPGIDPQNFYNNYIRSFLARDMGGRWALNKGPSYRYVDMVDPKDGKRYRYSVHIDRLGIRDPRSLAPAGEFELKKELAPDPAPRYGVTFDDITTQEERQLWIAGSSLKVVDLQTKEVIAERIGYMVDKGQGSKVAGRQPWDKAAEWSCPSFAVGAIGFPSGAQRGQTRRFVEKILKIKGE